MIQMMLTKILSVLILLGLLLACYWVSIRPGQLHWGATPEEVTSPLPGDDVVSNPTFQATRAITINGTPEEIWPWLVQCESARSQRI